MYKSLVIKQTKYRCPKHGCVGDTIGVEVHLTEFKGSFNIRRKYCIYCVVEMVDKYCHELEIQDEHSS